MPLNGKRIVLTGASGGIGTALAELLIQQHADLITVGRSNDAVDWVYDLNQELEVTALCQHLQRQPIDILINLAGLMYFGHLTEQGTDNIKNLLMVNLEVPIRLSQAVLPTMVKQGQGHIVNIGSVFGALPFPHFATYSATKAGLHGFSEALRREYNGKGISVTHVSPRAVKTPMNHALITELHKRTQVMHDEPQKVARIIVDAIIHKRKRVVIGQPESLFVKLNSFIPSLIDKALIAKRDIADQLLQTNQI